MHDSDTLPPLGLQTGATLSGNTLRGLEPRGGLNLQGKNDVPLHQNMVQTLRHKQKLAAERSSMATERERPMPCLPLRFDHPCSSSVVEKPSDLENQIGRMYFRSDPVKYCKTKEGPVSLSHWFTLCRAATHRNGCSPVVKISKSLRNL